MAIRNIQTAPDESRTFHLGQIGQTVTYHVGQIMKLTLWQNETADLENDPYRFTGSTMYLPCKSNKELTH